MTLLVIPLLSQHFCYYYYYFCFFVAVGTMVFDARVGLYDDPQNKDAVDMIHATLETFACWGKLVTGWESVLFRFATTPSYRKFCKAQDTMLAIGQKFVDNKVMELNNMAEQGNSFVDDQGKCSLTHQVLTLSLTNGKSSACIRRMGRDTDAGGGFLTTK